MELGLIGKSLAHSFSKDYFHEKFQQEHLAGYRYRNFELASIEDFSALLEEHPELAGLNVTVPYKYSVIPYLDEVSEEVRQIGAVNVIRLRDGVLKGFNTDHIGFSQSLIPLLKPHDNKALILGSGGASRAVYYSLEKLGISSLVVSRTPARDEISYEAAGTQLKERTLVVNCTPLGTWPETSEIPPLPLEYVSENHLFYDLIYNPSESRLLTEAKRRGARVKNGYEMLVLQAEAAWQIWHQD